MKIKKFNELNVIVDKKLELMLAIYAVYLRHHSEKREELDFIETPPIDYLVELEQLLNCTLHQVLIDDILKFTDESTCVEIALSLNDNYELDKKKVRLDSLLPYLGNVNLDDFVNNFKSFAKKVKWDDFFDSHKDFYQRLFSTFCDFPENLDLNDIEKFYGKKATSYNYIPSILMNGGFSYHDKLGNQYYIRGIQWWEEEKRFYYDKEYLLECLFHEFSHPLVNPLVDKYLSLFTNLDELYKEAINHGLPKSYSKMKILLYEYFVRTNAIILTKKYYADAKIEDWVIQRGFLHLNDFINFTIENMSKYRSYEEFFKNEMISFANGLSKNDNKLKRKQI